MHSPSLPPPHFYVLPFFHARCLLLFNLLPLVLLLAVSSSCSSPTWNGKPGRCKSWRQYPLQPPWLTMPIAKQPSNRQLIFNLLVAAGTRTDRLPRNQPLNLLCLIEEEHTEPGRWCGCTGTAPHSGWQGSDGRGGCVMEDGCVRKVRDSYQ